jgi:S-disulfanyl-L-cysteine oxidoreductase SoxD
MRCFLRYFMRPMVVLMACAVTQAQTPTYKLGRTPSEDEIRAWDIAIGPEGKELPPGSGTAKEGAKIYAQQCAGCHGPTGAEEGTARRLVGGDGTLNAITPVKTIGSYWPFATTVWNYINDAMPPNFRNLPKPPKSADEVYALTAFLLYRNGIIKESDVIDGKSLPKIQMPNRNGFVPSRPEWKPGAARPFGLYP